MDFTSIQYFLRVCELKSLTKAARDLYTTQPTLSRRIMAIEDELGVELLNRSTAGINLTDAGMLFYAEEKRLMQSHESLLRKMTEFKGQSCGLLHVCSAIAMFPKPLLYALRQMKNSFPNVEVEVLNMVWTDACRAFLEQKVDLIYGMRFMFSQLQNAKMQFVHRNRLAILVPQAHPFWNRDSVKLADLRGQLFVIEKRGVSGTEDVYQMLETNGVSLKSAVTADNSDDRFYMALSMNRLALGMEIPEYCNDFAPYFHLVPVVDANIDAADICVAYRKTLSMADRFASYVVDFKEDESSQP